MRWAIGVVVSAAAFFFGDEAMVRTRVPGSLGTVQVQPYYAVREKNGKIEYDFNVPAEMQTCTRSLFPHMGYSPCWYVERHRQKRIEI